MNYTLHQLHVFLEVVKERSITKASEALFLTQPAVSIQLKKFQDQFPLPLTEVIGRQLYITSFGEEIAEVAKNILEEVNKLEYKAKAYQGKLAGRMSISIVSTGKYVMPFYLSGFVQNHPAIDFTIDVTNKDKVVRDLEENKVDFALVSVLPKHIGLKKSVLLKNDLYLVGGSNLDKDRKSKINQIFLEQPLIYREQGSATRNAMETFIQGKNQPVSKKIELTSNEAVKQAVIAGLGYSIMPLIGIKKAIDDGEIVIIPYPGLPLSTQWNLIWLKNKKLSPAAEAFINYLENEKETIRKRHFNWVKK